MWTQQEKIGFEKCCKDKIGQISKGQMYNYIKTFSQDINNKTFLEIGTWNGHGSTKIFIDLLKQRDDIIFYSLECNVDKSKYAKNLYKDYSFANILNEIIVNNTKDEIFKAFPEVINNEKYKSWLNVDIDNINTCSLFLERENLPEIFDVVLFDGGEFTTYFEFQKIKNRSKYILLDDTNTNKCKKIVEEIYANKHLWEIIFHDSSERRGVLICKNKLL